MACGTFEPVRIKLTQAAEPKESMNKTSTSVVRPKAMDVTRRPSVPPDLILTSYVDVVEAVRGNLTNKQKQVDTQKLC